MTQVSKHASMPLVGLAAALVPELDCAWTPNAKKPSAAPTKRIALFMNIASFLSFKSRRDRSS